MTSRELWQNMLNYGEFDRHPNIHWTTWPETLERWENEGMPKGANQHAFLGTDPHWTGVSVNLSLLPAFEEETLEDTEEYRIFRASDGVIQQDWKHRSCIPHYIDFLLKEAKDWDRYRRRLQPDPARVPADLDKRIAAAEASGLPIVIGVASMMGWIRNWMGVENMCYLMYDDIDCYADMVDTLAELTCWGIDQVVPRMHTKPDLGFGWEDICGKTGPLVSPHIFDRAVAPGYRKIRDKLEEHGIGILGIDSDGMVEPLIPHWMESGVNLQFPIERGTWGATPEQMRRRFGKELRIVGGFDKLVLEKDKAAIDREIDSHVALIEEGGFVMMPDHLITPGTPLSNYQYYLRRVRELRF